MGNGEETGKVWPQYIAVITALFAAFNAGIHFGWPSPSVPQLLSDEYVFDVTIEEASYITIIGPVGDVAGSIIYPTIVDLIGRKKTILLIAVPQILSMSMIYFSFYSKTLLYIARFIGGLSEAACFTILPLYIGEVAEPKVRGTLGSYFSMSMVLGLLVANLVGSYLDIHTAALIFVSFPILFLAIFSRMPESPYYLIIKSKAAEAEAALRWLRKKKNVDAELQILTHDVTRQMSEPGRYKDLFAIKSNRSACRIMFGLRIIQQLSGISSFSLYMQTLFEKTTTVIPKHIASTLIFLLQFTVNFIATMVVDKVGRKPLMTISCLGCCIVLLLEGVYFTLQDFTTIHLSAIDYLPLIGIIIFIIAFTIGQGNVVNLMLGEMFSSSVKAKASCLMNILFAITMTVATKFFQYTSDNISMCVPFYAFGVCQLLGVVFCVVYVPETKGKSLEQIQQELKCEDKNTT